MAFDETIKSTLQRLATTLQQDVDTRLAEVAAELSAVADEDRLAVEAEAMATVAAQVAAARAEVEQHLAEATAKARDEAEQAMGVELSTLRGELEAARAASEELRQAADGAREQAERLREQLESASAELQRTHDRAVAAEQALGEMRERAGSAEHALGEARDGATAAEQALGEERDRATAAEHALGDARDRATTAEHALDEARNRSTAAEHALADARDRATAAEHALDDARSSSVTAQATERQQQLAALDRLIQGVRRVGAGATLSDVLDALGDSVAHETSRTAVLVASGDSYQPLRLNGFSGVAPSPIPRSALASLTRGLPFAPLPPERVGFTVPIEVGGQAVALVYADDCSGDPEAVPSCWPESIEVLARHASLRLETLTALRTVQALGAGRPAGTGSPVATIGSMPSTTEDDQSARRYARLLVSEIKLYNEGAVRLGRQHRDLLERLRPEIERARRVYEERVPAHVPARATYFDDELVQTLADGDPGLLGARR